MSLSTAYEVFKAARTIAQEKALERAERLMQAKYQSGDVVRYGRFGWNIISVSETGGGDLLYWLEREDLPGSRLNVPVSAVS